MYPSCACFYAFSQYRNLSISAFCKNVNKAARKNLSNILISGHIKTSSTYVFMWQNVTVQPLHLLVFIFMKTRSLVVPPYADLDEKSAYASKLATHFLIQTSAWLNCNDKICFLPLRLFSDISEDASVHIENVAVYKVRSLGSEEHCRSFEVLHRAPSRCRRLRDDELVEWMAGAVSLTFSLTEPSGM